MGTVHRPASESMMEPRASTSESERPTGSVVVRGDEAAFVDFGSFGVRFLARASQTGGALSIVEHPIPPLTLAAPLHRHSHEDEYSYVVEGTMGALLGSQVVHATAGSLVFKPRGEWHTFWNAGEGPCRVLEIIVPGGFEDLFAAMGADPTLMSGEHATALERRFGLDVDHESVARLCKEHGLTVPP